MKNFIITPRGGLVNQLQAIVKGILLSEKYNRNIYIDKFQCNIYDINNSLCNINEIIDINKMNNLLKLFNINVKILKNINNENYEKLNLDYNKISYFNYISNYINSNNNLDKNNLLLGNIVSLNINKEFNLNEDDYYNKYNLLLVKIPFIHNFYEIKNDIKKKLKLNIYKSIHLRLEDDSINYFSKLTNNTPEQFSKLLQKYYNECISQKNIINNKIEYGTINKKVDVTNKCKKIEIIPDCDIKRVKLFEIDPCPGELKSVFINNIEYKHNENIYLNTIYILSSILQFNNTYNLNYYNLLIKNNKNLVTKDSILKEKIIKLENNIIKNRELLGIIDLLIAYDSYEFFGFYASSFSILINVHHKINNKKTDLFKC